MSLPIIRLARRIVSGGSLRAVAYEFADSFSTTTANCSINTAGELLVDQAVNNVTLVARFPTGTTGTAFLAVRDNQAPSTTKPTAITGWNVIGNGVTISSLNATFTLSMNNTNGLSAGVGICAYTMRNNASSVNVGSQTSTISSNAS
jgi:hypothetical protein